MTFQCFSKSSLGFRVINLVGYSLRHHHEMNSNSSAYKLKENVCFENQIESVLA